VKQMPRRKSPPDAALRFGAMRTARKSQVV
jgi:hypothetical protein